MQLNRLRHEWFVADQHRRATLAAQLSADIAHIETLIKSHVDRSSEVEPLLALNVPDLAAQLAVLEQAEAQRRWLKKEQRKERLKRQQESYEAERQEREARWHRHRELIHGLAAARENFAGVGTRKAKLRLNKIQTPIARALRLALEIEDANITAKKYFGEWRKEYYDRKSRMLRALCQIFRAEGWAFGQQPSDVPPAQHVVYFEFPTAGQVSWHATVRDVPKYRGTWDGRRGSSLEKLDRLAREVLSGNAPNDVSGASTT